MNLIDVIASHHAYVKPSIKCVSNFKRALFGVNTAENGLKIIWTVLLKYLGDNQDLLSHHFVRIAKWMSLNPAKILGIDQKFGSIEKGKFASFIVWRPYEKCYVSFTDFEYSKTNLYKGLWLNGNIDRVYVRGRCAFRDSSCFPVGDHLNFNSI